MLKRYVSVLFFTVSLSVKNLYREFLCSVKTLQIY